MAHIRFLVSSDTHGFIFPYDYASGRDENYGLARLSTLVNSLRDENTLLIDNGDALEGSPLTFFHYHNPGTGTCPVTTVMNAMGYDYVNVGNHDFDYGQDALREHLDALKAPCITANAFDKKVPLGPTYVVREFGGKKVALFGLTTPAVTRWEPAGSIRDFAFTSAAETAARTVELLKRLERPDYILCFYHGGFEKDLMSGQPGPEAEGENEACRILETVRGIDVLVTGHQHLSVSSQINGVIVTQTAANGAQLACIDINTSSNAVKAALLNADGEADPKILALVQKEEDACQQWLDQPLGTTALDLSIKDEMEARFHKSQVITFLNMVQMEATGADLSAASLFVGATGFPQTITMRSLVSTYSYPNTLVVKKITGRILRAYLEKCAEYFTVRGDLIAVSPVFNGPKPKYYNYDMIDGISYTIKAINDPGRKVVSLTYQGKEVTDDMEFTIALNSFRARCGNDFGMLAKCKTLREINTSMVDLIAEYVMKHHVVDFKPVNNITVIR